MWTAAKAAAARINFGFISQLLWAQILASAYARTYDAHPRERSAHALRQIVRKRVRPGEVETADCWAASGREPQRARIPEPPQQGETEGSRRSIARS